MTQSTRGSWIARSAAVLALSVSVAACESLLEVELPGQVTEDATFVPAQARLLVNSAIADIECALSDFTAFEAAGNEDNTTRTVGWWGSRFERPVTPNGGQCSTGETSVGWFSPLHKGRWMAEQVYTKLQNDWTGVADREELMGTAALYAGLAYTHFGEFFCEVTADAGPLMTWQESLAKGEQWFTDALTHIQAAGDYSIATGVTTSAQQMAYLLRARARIAQNTPAKLAEAALDAAQIQQGFTSSVTRESGGERTRWNRVYSAHVGLGWVILLGPVDWWSGTSSNMPALLGGGAWPAVIPFTGYWDLAILADGRAVSDTGYPITLADASTPADSTADPRVLAVPSSVGGVGGGGGPYNYPQLEQAKYTSQGDDFPLAKWEEAWLIQAQAAGGATAITLVNEIRAAHSLPQITGAYLTSLTDGTNDASEIQIMLLEEIRRSHYLESGRWWSTKLRYDLWFPRGEGVDRWNFGYQTGVRMVFPNGEFTANPNLDEADQGSGCAPNQNPVV
ncbi:MAG: hypothetical protein OEO79_03290 [Gemmatimonadota bacterium]|nr:hypothetical protein [Gemmatimonadota bacterium]MDH3422440.1 hypothetical protein [Gemmatimonadota bacterium]